MEEITLSIDGVKYQLLQGLTPIQVFELYAKKLEAAQVPAEGLPLLKAEAMDAIQAAWKQVRRKAIFARLKNELGKKEDE